MRLKYDRQKLKESLELGAYDERNLTICKCGKHHFPSKLMFIRFLEQFKDVKGVADIWSISHIDKGTVEIHVDVTYQVPDLGSGEKNE